MLKVVLYNKIFPEIERLLLTENKCQISQTSARRHN